MFRVLGEFDQRASIVPQKLHKCSQADVDHLVELLGRHVDEGRREVGQQLLEPQAFLSRCLCPLAIGNVQHGAYQCRFTTVVDSRSQHLDVDDLSILAHTTCLIPACFRFTRRRRRMCSATMAWSSA